MIHLFRFMLSGPRALLCAAMSLCAVSAVAQPRGGGMSGFRPVQSLSLQLKVIDFEYNGDGEPRTSFAFSEPVFGIAYGRPNLRASLAYGEQAAAAPPEPKPEPTNGKHVPAAAAALPAASVAPGADDGRQLSVLRDIARRMYQAVTDVAHGLEPDDELRSELLQMCEDWQVELEPVCPVVDRKALLREFESLSDDDLLSLRDLIQGRT